MVSPWSLDSVILHRTSVGKKLYIHECLYCIWILGCYNSLIHLFSKANGKKVQKKTEYTSVKQSILLFLVNSLCKY